MILVEATRGAFERFGPAGADLDAGDLEGFDNAGEFRAGKLGRHGIAIAAKQVLGEDIGAGDDQDAILVDMDIAVAGRPCPSWSCRVICRRRNGYPGSCGRS